MFETSEGLPPPELNKRPDFLNSLVGLVHDGRDEVKDMLARLTGTRNMSPGESSTLGWSAGLGTASAEYGGPRKKEGRRHVNLIDTDPDVAFELMVAAEGWTSLDNFGEVPLTIHLPILGENDLQLSVMSMKQGGYESPEEDILDGRVLTLMPGSAFSMRSQGQVAYVELPKASGNEDVGLMKIQDQRLIGAFGLEMQRAIGTEYIESKAAYSD